jgi:hypothetical protein
LFLFFLEAMRGVADESSLTTLPAHFGFCLYWFGDDLYSDAGFRDVVAGVVGGWSADVGGEGGRLAADFVRDGCCCFALWELWGCNFFHVEFWLIFCERIRMVWFDVVLNLTFLWELR